MYNKKPFNLILWVQVYLTATLIFFFVGPVRWNINNSIILISFVLIYQICIYLGYKVGFRHKESSYISTIKLDKFIRFYPILLVSTLITNILYLIRVTKLVPGRTLSDVIIYIFTNPRILYISASQSNLSSSDMFGGRPLALLILITGPLTVALIPLSLVFFKRISSTTKMIAMLSIFVQILLSVSVGTSEGYMNIIIYVLTGILVLSYNRRNIRVRTRYKLLFVSVASIGIILVSNLLINRNLGSYSLSIGNNGIELSKIYAKLPKNIVDSIVYLNIYSTQGYYGMSLALKLNWTPTFGVGFSNYVISNINELMNANILMQTFMGKAEIYGWGALVNWHTAYTWWANDFHWIGVTIVMFFLGYLLGKTYSDSIYSKNPYAIVLLSLLLMSIIFIPANNKVFAAPQTFISFFVYLILYITTDIGNKTKRRIKNE